MTRAHGFRASRLAATAVVSVGLILGAAGCASTLPEPGVDGVTEQPSESAEGTEGAEQPAEMDQEAYRDLAAELVTIDGVIGVALAADGKIVVRTTESEPTDDALADDPLTALANKHGNIVIKYNSEPLSAF